MDIEYSSISERRDHNLNIRIIQSSWPGFDLNFSRGHFVRRRIGADLEVALVG
jgi:hypothetical protein